MKKLNVSFLILILIVTLLNHTNAQDFQINDTRLGDENVSYVNPEISPVGDYMVWIEIDTTNGFSGQVWHCGLDPDTGDLIPSNGKGFSAFAANVYGRPADWGLDANGPYYVGLNLAGQFVVVRPTGATSANVEVLSTPPDNRRRVIYPSQLPGVDARFMVYILNENVPGWSNNPANNSFELRFMNLDNPNEEITIETQTRTFPSAVGMDVIVPRWIKSTPYLTYGFFDNNNFAQIKEFNAFAPLDSPLVVTNDQNIKTDGHPINNPFNNKQYIVSGFGGGESALVYRRNQPSQSFVSIETITTPTPNLLNPTLNQSHEPFFFDDQLYTTFQVNEDGGTFLDTTWNEPGEIWITSIDDLQQNMWLINDFDTELNISEPEPYTGNDKIFVYYSGKA
ncbi:MAG TPA: hypothetical protein DDX98_02790, partial [Bacteroidales bacterium]|nr:hypothetical protein [Bacteroidales bacterium]